MQLRPRRAHPSEDLVLTSAEAHVDCRGLKCVGLKQSATPAETRVYIQAASKSTDAPTSCLLAAYNSLSSLSLETRIPILLSLLSVERPQTRRDLQSEADGSSFTVTIPSRIDRYDAALALVAIGEPAMPAVLEYIATDPSDNQIAWQNAVFVYEISNTQRRPLAQTFASLAARRSQARDAAELARLGKAIDLLTSTYCRSSTACEAKAPLTSSVPPSR